MSDSTVNQQSEPTALAALRRFLLIVFLIGLIGTGAELLLIGHTEKFWQPAPLALMALGLISVGWCVAARGRASLRSFQVMMVLFVISGFLGLFFHYQGNVEFELEMYPSMEGVELFWKAIKGASPPTLAPGTMIELGLLGWAYTFRHPALTAPAGKESET